MTGYAGTSGGFTARALTRTPAPEYESGMGAPLIRILGIDPGLRRTGWGVVDVLGNRLIFVACGSVETDERSRRGRSPGRHPRRAGAGVGRASAAGGGGRGDLRQQECDRDPQARAGARHRAAGAGAGRRERRRIRAEPGEENHRRRRPWREGADPHDDLVLLPKADAANGGRRRRARHRGHACAPSAERRAAGGWRDDRQAQRHHRQLRRGLRHRRRQWRRLRGALLGAHPAGAAGAGRGGDARRSRPMCARIRSACSAFWPTSSANGSGCCRPCRASAPRWRWRSSARSSRPISRRAIAMRDKAMVTRTPGVGPKVAERIVTELKDKAPAYTDARSGGGAALGRGRREARAGAGRRCGLGAGQSRLWSAAGGSRDRRGGARPRARARIRAQLIRLGLKELAK